MDLQSGRTPLFTLEIPSLSIINIPEVAKSNLNLSTLLTNLNPASYTVRPLKTLYLGCYCFWHPSRPGFFYFSFNDGSLKACQASQKLAIEVTSAMPPELSPLAAPAPSSGGEMPLSPPFPWPFLPLQAASPGPVPSANSLVTVPLVPEK
ncbi:hypothetical protein SESBI_50109, partial [Sesbania bispinosa]